jgi:uncharacterized membrane protein
MSAASLLKRPLWFLCILFCVAYPIAVTGVAFNVQPPFSLAWAGSALLFLEGTLVTCAMLISVGWRRGLLASLLIIALSYLVEAIGVNTGFPFGVYHYTAVLFPLLPGHVPLAVMFAWLMVISGSYGWLYRPTRRLSLSFVLVGAALAMLLDLEIEPVASHLEHYWQWLTPTGLSCYGVPLTNFAAWFAVAALLLWLTDRLIHSRGDLDSIVYRETAGGHNDTTDNQERKEITASYNGTPLRYTSRLALLVPRVLFAASLFMFGLVDLTHGYYLAVGMGLLAAVSLYIVSSFP